MFCPNCRVEFREGYEICSDCRVALVPELPRDPEKAPRPDLKLVTVWETYDPLALAFAKSVLESADIAFVSPNENFLRMYGHTSPLLGASPALGSFFLQVAEEDADSASRLLADVEQRRYFDEDPDAEP